MELTYPQALALLDSRGFGITPGLARIAALTEMLSSPQLNYPTVHLAGTNGKTSTARILTAVLAAHGLTTGLYTSPHLHEITERFAVAGWDGGLLWDQMTPEDFARTLSYLLPFIELIENDMGQSLTYFEITTALAFEWMSERAVGAGVIETGMGGRWDATNLVQSEVAVLTPVDVDHAQFLGSTPGANGAEKVDIVKEGSTVVSAPQPPEVDALLAERADAVGARTLRLGQDFSLDVNLPAVGGRSVGISTERSAYQELYLPLHGAHQGLNLALAVAAAEAFLGRELDPELLQGALNEVTSPGRLEVAGRQPLVVLDGAHNPNAAEALRSTLASDFLFQNLTLVLSIFDDKDFAGVLGHLVPAADRVILTRSASPRSATPEALRAAAPVVPGHDPPEMVEPIQAAVDRALQVSGREDMVLITGSIHGVGEARAHLLGSGS